MKRSLCPSRTAMGFVLILIALFSAQLLAHADKVLDAQLQYDRALALEEVGKHAEAISEWRKVLDIGGAEPSNSTLLLIKAQSLLSLAEVQRQADQLDEALASFNQVLTIYPQFPRKCAEATLCIAKIHQKHQHYLPALSMYAKTIRDYPYVAPRSDFARVRIGQVLKLYGQVPPVAQQIEIDEAIAVNDAAATTAKAVEAAMSQAKVKAKTGNVEEAKSGLLSLFSISSVNLCHLRLFALGNAQLVIKDAANAKITFDRYLAMAAKELVPEELDRTRINVLYNQSLVDDSLLPTVISEAKEILQTYPDTISMIEVRYYLGRAYDRTGDIDNCMQAYNYVCARYPASNKAEARAAISLSLDRMGQRLRRQGKTAEAEAMFLKILNDYPDTSIAESVPTSLAELRAGR